MLLRLGKHLGWKSAAHASLSHVPSTQRSLQATASALSGQLSSFGRLYQIGFRSQQLARGFFTSRPLWQSQPEDKNDLEEIRKQVLQGIIETQLKQNREEKKEDASASSSSSPTQEVKLPPELKLKVVLFFVVVLTVLYSTYRYFALSHTKKKLIQENELLRHQLEDATQATTDMANRQSQLEITLATAQTYLDRLRRNPSSKKQILQSNEFKELVQTINQLLHQSVSQQPEQDAKSEEEDAASKESDGGKLPPGKFVI